MNRRKYNKKRYSTFAKINGQIRKKVTPDPFSGVKRLGLYGMLINKICNKASKKSIHKLTYNTVDIFYDKKTDGPFKGSVLYTCFKVIYCCSIGIIINLLIRGLL